VVSSSVKRPIEDGDAMIAEALRYADDPNAPRVEGALTAGEGTHSGAGESWGARTRRVLMTGVSYMIPFVAAGGLMIALGFLFGGYEIVGPYGQIAVHNTLFNLPNAGALKLDHVLGGTGFGPSAFFAYIGALFFIIGKTAFALFIPAFAGYVAYAIADRPGIAPGFIMGGLAANLFNVTDANGNALPATGFLGAIIGGVLAGLVAHWIASWRVPAWARGLMPVMVIPLLTSIIAGFIMIIVLGKPIYWVMTELNRGLNNMSGSSAILLGIILGRHRSGEPGRRRAPAEDHGLGDAGRHGAADRARSGDGAPPPAVHRRRARERQGRLAARCLVHHRGCHPVRSGRPAAGDPVDHAG
jgi:PTS system fructose-specific IIC component